MKILRTTLTTICLFLITFSANACKNCEEKIILSQTKWQCLAEKLPKLLETKHKLIVFKLEDKCQSTQQSASYKSGRAGQPQKGSDSDDKVYIVTKKQLLCLQKALPSLLADGAKEFDFTTKCEA